MNIIHRAISVLAAVLVAACAGQAAPQSEADLAAIGAGSEAPTRGVLPPVIVHKSPTCGCCTKWVDHLRASGFEVEVQDHAPDALSRLKSELGVPFGKGSCHTAEVAGLFVEGHVPAEDVKRLLDDPGEAKGLVLPGMPLGSPGMEVPDGSVQPYTVERVEADGQTTPFASH